MASSRKRRRLAYSPSDPDMPLGLFDVPEMLLFPKLVWNRMMSDSPGSEVWSRMMSLLHVVCTRFDISELFVASIHNFISISVGSAENNL